MPAVSAFEAAAWLCLLFWIGLTLDRKRAWPAELTLPAGKKHPPEEATILAVIPARDEAELLSATLPSVLAQEVGSLHVVLVDDGSTDGTGEAARAAAAASGFAARLLVIEAPSRPAGWSGKVHALACGVEAAGAAFRGAVIARASPAEEPGVSRGAPATRGPSPAARQGSGPAQGEPPAARLLSGSPPEWLLFTDADIRHRPGSLTGLLERAAEGPCDLVSVMARLRAETLWERLLIPPFVFFFQLLYPFRRVRRPESKVAAAAGGCVLVRRAALERAGGLAAIRGAVIDDVALARAVKGTGGRLWLGFDPGIESLRAYPRLRDLRQMVARTAFIQLRRRWDLLAAVEVGLLLFFVAPLALVPAGLALATLQPADEVPALRAAACGALAWLLQAAALRPSVRHHRAPAVYAWTLPIASTLYGLMTLASAWAHLRGRGAAWKGRAYGAAR